MASIRLLPYRLRDDKFVPLKDAEPMELHPRDVMAKFGMDPRNGLDMTTMRMLVPNSFVGLLKNKQGTPIRFYLKNDDLTADVSWLIKKDPSFSDRLVEVWMVDHTTWDSKVTE